MKDFKEFQFGWVTLIFVVPVHILITHMYVNNVGSRPMGLTSYVFTSIVFVTICFLFYGLTTTITNTSVTISFGIGLITKKFKLGKIEEVTITKNNHLYGWGIRFIPKGMLYNISGTEAVELKFKDSDRIVRIGTQNPLQLTEELNKRL